MNSPMSERPGLLTPGRLVTMATAVFVASFFIAQAVFGDRLEASGAAAVYSFLVPATVFVAGWLRVRAVMMRRARLDGAAPPDYRPVYVALSCGVLVAEIALFALEGTRLLLSPVGPLVIAAAILAVTALVGVGMNLARNGAR